MQLLRFLNGKFRTQKGSCTCRYSQPPLYNGQGGMYTLWGNISILEIYPYPYPYWICPCKSAEVFFFFKYKLVYRKEWIKSSYWFYQLFSVYKFVCFLKSLLLICVQLVLCCKLRKPKSVSIYRSKMPFSKTHTSSMEESAADKMQHSKKLSNPI